MIDTDRLRDRLHERLTDPRGLRAYCDNCGAGLTEADHTEGCCTQCGEDIDDREFDEDLIDDSFDRIVDGDDDFDDEY